MMEFMRPKKIDPISDQPSQQELRDHIATLEKKTADLEKKDRSNPIADHINAYAEKHPGRTRAIGATGLGLVGLKIGIAKGAILAPFVVARDAIKYGKTSQMNAEALEDVRERIVRPSFGAMADVMNPKIFAAKSEIWTDIASEGFKSRYTAPMARYVTGSIVGCTAIGAGAGFLLMGRLHHPGDLFSHPLQAIGEAIIGSKNLEDPSPKTQIATDDIKADGALALSNQAINRT